mgnify:FL=1
MVLQLIHIIVNYVGGLLMICKRCESYLNKHNKSIAYGYCKHCMQAIIKNNADLEFFNAEDRSN